VLAVVVGARMWLMLPIRRNDQHVTLFANADILYKTGVHATGPVLCAPTDAAAGVERLDTGPAVARAAGSHWPRFALPVGHTMQNALAKQPGGAFNRVSWAVTWAIGTATTALTDATAGTLRATQRLPRLTALETPPGTAFDANAVDAAAAAAHALAAAIQASATWCAPPPPRPAPAADPRRAAPRRHLYAMLKYVCVQHQPRGVPLPDKRNGRTIFSALHCVLRSAVQVLVVASSHLLPPRHARQPIPLTAPGIEPCPIIHTIAQALADVHAGSEDTAPLQVYAQQCWLVPRARTSTKKKHSRTFRANAAAPAAEIARHNFACFVNAPENAPMTALQGNHARALPDLQAAFLTGNDAALAGFKLGFAADRATALATGLRLAADAATGPAADAATGPAADRATGLRLAADAATGPAADRATAAPHLRIAADGCRVL
jgi:hypothetical protein